MVGWRSQESAEGCRRKPRRGVVRREVCEVQDRSGKKDGKNGQQQKKRMKIRDKRSK